MAKIRVRKETGTLYLDFHFQGVRCREQTALPDTTANNQRLNTLLKRIVKEIKQGTFDYGMTFPNSPRAEQFAISLPPIQDAVGGTQTAKVSTPTLVEFSHTWRAEMAPQWRRLHRDGVDQIFNKHLLPRFGNQPVGDITKADVLTFRAALAELPGRAGKKMSASRINKIMTIFRQMLNEASERFNTSPAFRGIRPLKARRPDVQPFSIEDVDRIRNTIRADYRNYVTVRFFSGMRTGEINGLKWKYVDFESELILVREIFSAGETEENAKTEGSLRDIPMLPMVKEALQDQYEQRDPDNPYVFSTRHGGPIDANNFANRVWYPLLRYLDLEKRRPYQTRHTTATMMLAAGENPEWIARLMGHANTQMLFTVYSRFVPNLTRQDGRAITGLLNSRTTTPEPPTATDLSSLTRKQLETLLRSMTSDATQENHHAR